MERGIINDLEKSNFILNIKLNNIILFLKMYINKMLRPVCCKKFGKTFKLYWLLLFQINNDLKPIYKTIIKLKFRVIMLTECENWIKHSNFKRIKPF